MTQREFEVFLREAILLDAKTEPQLRERPQTARPKARPWYRQFGRMVEMLFLSFGLFLGLGMTNAEANKLLKIPISAEIGN